jgi:hypothetical protein
VPTASRADTRELDQLLAAHFGWWDILVENKQPVEPSTAAPADSRTVAAVVEQPTLLGDEQPV